MNKPIAILKDSLREAWDSKILLVLIILSAIFALLLASVGYRPTPAEKVFSEVRRDLRQPMLDHGKVPLPFASGSWLAVNYSINNFTELEGASNPANGRYRFMLKMEISEDTERPMRPKRKNADAPEPEKEKKAAKDNEKKEDPTTSPFLETIIAWNLDSTEFFKMARDGQQVNIEQAKKLLAIELNDATLEKYIKERLEHHYNVKIESVTRQPGSFFGNQEFEVTTGKSDPRNWVHSPSVFFGAFNMSFIQTSLGRIIFNIEDVLVNGIGAAIALALGVIVTAFFLPNMLRKGAVDLMLAKPTTRVLLLLYKYLGGLSFMLIIATVSVGLVWVVLGIRSGIWNLQFLVVIPMLTFTFALLYSISTLMSVWTRSAIASMLVTLAFSGLLWGLGAAYSQIEQIRKVNKDLMPAWLDTTADIVNTVLPRTRDLDVFTSKLLAETMSEADQTKTGVAAKEMPSVAGTFGVSLAWIAFFLGLACWRFSVKDY